MKHLLTICAIVLVTAEASAQYTMPRPQDSIDVAVFVPDSVRMKITKTGTVDGKKIIWLRDDKPVKPLRTKGWRQRMHKYITVCPCKKLPPEVRKGKYITIPTSRIEVIRVGIRKQDLEL